MISPDDIKQEGELRPETSKCSRLEKRRLVSQNHCRQESINTQTRQKITGITLDQYFRGTNFKVVEINEDEWELEQHPQKIPPLQNTNFRIKTGKKRQDTMSNKKLMERSPLQQQTRDSKQQQRRTFNKPRPHITSNEFFKNEEDQLRQTNMEIKYGKLREDIVNRFSHQEQDLLNKYADKFNIYSSNPPKLSLAPRDLYAKIK